MRFGSRALILWIVLGLTVPFNVLAERKNPMAYYKLIQKESELIELQKKLEEIVAKGPSSSKWYGGSSDIFSDVSQPSEAGFLIDSVFDTISRFELSDENFRKDEFSNYPQWMYWLRDNLNGGQSRSRFDSMYKFLYKWNRRSTQAMTVGEKDRLIGLLIDSSALLPTNLTSTRLSYYVRNNAGVPLRARLRFMIGYIVALQEGRPESVCAQFGVVAALPRPIITKEDHRDLWSGGMPSPRDYDINDSRYVPLEFILNKGGLNFGSLEHDGLLAI